MESEQRLLGLDEASRILAVTRRTVERMISRGQLIPTRISGIRRVFIDVEQLDRLLGKEAARE